MKPTRVDIGLYITVVGDTGWRLDQIEQTILGCVVAIVIEMEGDEMRG